MNWKVEKLQRGESFRTKEKGNSMTPLIMSQQEHLLAPIKIDDVKVGDIVYCRLGRTFYTHLVTAIGERGVQISNNHGHVNGWTKNVYGKVMEIY